MSPSIVWTPANPITDCGQHTVVVSNSARNGAKWTFTESEMDKGGAKRKVGEMITRGTRIPAPNPTGITLRWFYENRFLPHKEEQWKITSRPERKRCIENYVLKGFGDTLFPTLDNFTLQIYLNELAPNFSKSVLSIPHILFHLSDRDRLIVRMFLVLGLRPGEMSALRWNDKRQNRCRSRAVTK